MAKLCPIWSHCSSVSGPWLDSPEKNLAETRLAYLAVATRRRRIFQDCHLNKRRVVESHKPAGVIALGPML